MKKMLIFFPLILACLSIYAQEPLGLSMEDFDILPGETKKVNISMQNTGYDIISAQFTLNLPEGLTLVRTGSNKPVLLEDRIGYGMVEDEEMYSEKAIQVGTKNPYIFLIYSTVDQLPFDGESGPFMTIAIKADANATIGINDVKLSGIELSTKDAPHKTSEYICKVNIYKNCTVTLNVAEEQGTVTGAGTFKSGTDVTVSAAANEGYEFVKWTDGINDVSTENPYTFSITDDIALSAVFEAKSQIIVYPMHESGVGTLFLPFDSEVPEGLQVFTATDVVDNVVILEQKDFIKAGVPLIVMGENSEYRFTGIPTFTDENASVGMLTGTTVITMIESGYVLQTQDNVTGFYRVEALRPITIPAYHCWLNYNGNTNVIEFKDLPNSIRDIDIHKDITSYYDLLGRKLSEVHTGIYIINKKKMFIRH